MKEKAMRIILVADHASIDFGGEAALPCHYFRVLLARKVDVFLVVHSRSEAFLREHFSEHRQRILYVEDTKLHYSIDVCQRFFPDRLAYLSFGFILRTLTQVQQKKMIKQLVADSHAEQIPVLIHQVIPVSPKAPSLMYGFGVPVIYGPLNGGMSYPPGFTGYESAVGLWFNAIGRRLSGVLNRILPGKREASLILVANQRSENALPKGLKGKVVQVVDNGVDLSLWTRFSTMSSASPSFVYVGRLIPLKGVDILLDAFFAACDQYGSMTLHIIGDGDERRRLEAIVAERAPANADVCFQGWLAQADIASFMEGARALVLPSLHDCGGAVLLEAMASSLAVIATNWGGPADYLDQDCGFLVDPSSRLDLVDGFRDALLLLANDPEKAKRMGEAGRRKVENEYDWERKMDEMLVIYREQL